MKIVRRGVRLVGAPPEDLPRRERSCRTAPFRPRERHPHRASESRSGTSENGRLSATPLALAEDVASRVAHPRGHLLGALADLTTRSSLGAEELRQHGIMQQLAARISAQRLRIPMSRHVHDLRGGRAGHVGRCRIQKSMELPQSRCTNLQICRT